jgi:acetyltransferase-like isoleucine patch superfamily enzyme
MAAARREDDPMAARLRRWQRRLIQAWRVWRLKRLVASVGQDVHVNAWPILYYPEQIRIGDRCSINHGVILGGRGGLTIGDDVRMSPYAVIEGGLLDIHQRDGKPLRHLDRPVVIGNRVWIATGATVLGGVTVGDDAVVAAGAVVTKDVPAGHIAKGVPARCTPLAPRDQAAGEDSAPDRATTEE